MNAFFGELGKRLTEKWLTLVILPSLLFCGAATVAITLGQRHWRDVRRLSDLVTDLKSFTSPSSQAVLLISGILLGATAAGLVADFLAHALSRLWLAEWPSFLENVLGRRLTGLRTAKWWAKQNRVAAAVTSGAEKEKVNRHAAERNAIALAPPQRPTWMGDRMAAMAQRSYVTYSFDPVFSWPHLWLIASDAAKEELRDCRSRFDAATHTAAWGLMYVILGLTWWPALPFGTVALCVGWSRAREATDGFASLAEAVVDLHGPELVVRLGVAPEAHLNHDTGAKITRQTRKGA
jgi:hypothetical protein